MASLAPPPPRPRFLAAVALALLPALSAPPLAEAFAPIRRGRVPAVVGRGTLPASSSAADAAVASDAIDSDAGAAEQSKCEVLLLDHFNLNHERGRHDAVKAFYFDFLGCAIDPRKYENYLAGGKTLWANAGLHQFHLPEGAPDAQVLDGIITLVHSDLDALMERYHAFLDGEDERFAPLKETEFLVGVVDDMMMVTDPWGNEFHVLQSDDVDEDRAATLGAQPTIEGHEPSEALKVEDLTAFVPHDANLDGIGRFYERVLGAPTVTELSWEDSISVAMGERQTLTFRRHPEGSAGEATHHDFDHAEGDEGEDSSLPKYPVNRGPHVSLYVTDLAEAYRRAEELGALYVNRRFKRRAYASEEAIDQCMFRIIDIVDPLDEGREVIVRLEHEVRSATTRDGRRYKSCPLSEVPV
ncbi:hypothetical protein ACHAWF_002528 [Thalassiosira exigua]